MVMISHTDSIRWSASPADSVAARWVCGEGSDEDGEAAVEAARAEERRDEGRCADATADSALGVAPSCPASCGWWGGEDWVVVGGEDADCLGFRLTLAWSL